MKDAKRVVFKARGMIFFRRCFLVKRITWLSDVVVVEHGIGGRVTTIIPLEGTVIRIISR